MAKSNTTIARQRNIERAILWRQKNPHASRERNKKLRQLDPVAYIANLIFLNARRRACASGLDFDIDRDWICSKIQQMRCEATGICFDITDAHRGSGRVSPYTPSIDRRNNKLGYTKTNCRLVIWFYNQAKSDLDDSSFRFLIKSIAQTL